MDTDLAFDPAVPLDPDARAGPAGGAFNPVTGELHFPLPPLGPPDPHAPQRSYVLTPMQDAFARHYVACGNGAEAARRAGYSHRNARYLARDNLRHPQVRWRIRDLVADRTRVQRGERVWVLTMLNHALTMATQQQLPNTMIRALSHMARLSGLEPPPRRARPQVGDPADDPVGEADADVFAGPDGYPGGHPGGHPDDTLDLARTLLPDDPPGALMAAVLGDGRDIALNRHPRAGGGPGGDGQDAARAGLKPAPTEGTPHNPCRGGSQTRPEDGEPGAVEQQDGACGDAAGETGRDAGSAMDSRLRGNDGGGSAATSTVSRHPRESGDPGAGEQNAGRAGLKPAPTGTPHNPCRGGSQTRPDDGETGAVEQEDGACGDAAGETGRDAGGAMDSRLRGNDGEGNTATSVVSRHPRESGDPGAGEQNAGRAGLKPAPTGTPHNPCRGGSQTRPEDGEPGAVEQQDGACGDAAGETGRDAGSAMDSRLRGNDGGGSAATSVVSRHPRESGDPGAGEQNAGRAGLKPAPTGTPHNPCRGGSQTRPDDGETGDVEQEDDGTGNATGVAASTFLHIPPHPAEKEKRPPRSPEGSAAARPREAAAGVEGAPAAEVGDGATARSPGSCGLSATGSG